MNTEEYGLQQGQDLCDVRKAFLFIMKQEGIFSDIFLERILGMVTSDDPYTYVVAMILHLSLPFCSLPSHFLFALPARMVNGALSDEM